MINKSQKALIALGSNQASVWGDPASVVRKAIENTENLFSCAAVSSFLYRTAAFPAGSGPDYINAAIAIETDDAPALILSRLHGIEAAAGRTRQVRWGARTLDLDLIAVDQQVLPDRSVFHDWLTLDADAQRQSAPDQLILPHPRLQDRAFVLVPLADIAPDWRHPVLGKTVKALCAALPQDQLDEVQKLPAQP